MSEYRNGKQVERDAEVPSTDDPVLLQRARQATTYMHSQNRNDNPFKGLPPDQLELIAYDRDGPYTANERHAALQEQRQQGEDWRVSVCAAGVQEWNTTGKTIKFLEEVLRYVEALPPVARASFPEDYEDELVRNIQRERTRPADDTNFKERDYFLEVLRNLIEKDALLKRDKSDEIIVDPRIGAPS